MTELKSKSMWLAVEEHMKHCKTCISGMAKILYHAQADNPRVHGYIDDFMGDAKGNMTHEEYMKDIKDFDKK